LQDATVDIEIKLPGAFEYFVEYFSGGAKVKAGSGSFVVDPYLAAGTRDTPLNGLNILTVIPKWMPAIDAWPEFFDDFAETGYNMVHFAPVNTRGISNSPYAIYDQLSLSDDLFSHIGLSEDEKHEKLRSTLSKIKTDNSIMSISDIVWNHTACNSEWLQHHPEAGILVD
jgi:glycogen debranching enzyme